MFLASSLSLVFSHLFEESAKDNTRRMPGVIDFWLDEVVFPVEAKCFPQKIASTAWDLCSDHGITTGFSGTDDTRLLLPLTIEQKNLPGLACTNGIVLRNLLKQAGDTCTKRKSTPEPDTRSCLFGGKKFLINMVPAWLARWHFVGRPRTK